MEWWMWLAVVGGMVLFVTVFTMGWAEAVDRARAWRLYDAGLIDAAELRRRIGY